MLVVKIAFVVAVTALAWFSVPAAVIAICATILAAVHGKANSIIEVSFGPLKAKLEREIGEAERLVSKLRDFASIQAKAAIAASVHTGRFATNTDWVFTSAKRLEEALREMGLSEIALRDARSDLVKLTLFDIGHCATGGGLVPSRFGQEAVREWTEARTKGIFSDPDEVEKWLKRWNVYTPAHQQLVDDMRWIKENDDVRDREQYLRGRSPIEWS